ncbi:MAG: sugar-transfer associated ATP-grasp domain-containing protein [Methylocella sp.]
MAMLEHAPRDRAREPACAAQGLRLGVFRHNFRNWIALSQYGFPFTFGPCRTPVSRFRALARRTRFARSGRPFRTLAHIAMTLGWPVGACLTARATSARMYLGIDRHETRVFFDMAWLALRHSIPPLEYALYRFNEPARRKDLHEYVYWNDLPGLAALNARLGADNRDVQDKDRFARICAANGFPHVQTLAVFESGRQVYPATPFAPDIAQIFVKALRLKGGAGGAKWIRDGAAYRDSGGRRIPAAKLGDEFRKFDCLVQPFVENHQGIARVTNGALASLRIVTGLDGSERAEFVTSLISLPHGKRETTVGGIICGIERETGRVRHAAFPDGGGVECHPDTGLPIVGIMLPYWRESIELVQRAHQSAFARFAFLGWDVALTNEGPLLLETNSGWGALFHQVLDGPLGHTAFSRLVGRYA